MPKESKKNPDEKTGSGQMQQGVMPEVYVVVAANDKGHKMPNREDLYYDDGGPLVFEQYTKTADLESIKKRAAYMQIRYGKCRIARLEFIEA